MPRTLALAALSAVLLLPAAEACDLAFVPFDQPSWGEEGDLRFVEGDRLVRVQDGRETAVAQGFFLSYADGDGGLVIAGQEGLGADCSGTPWLRADGFERSGLDRNARVFQHEGGPLVVHEGRLWRWADGSLQRTEWAVPADSYVQGVTADGGPVYRSGETVVVGGHALPFPASEPYSVGHNGTHTAIASSGPQGARLLFVAADGTVDAVAWPAGEDWRTGVAWTGTGWIVTAGGRAFLVAPGPSPAVTDLGVAAVSVGARGPQPVAFQQDGYTVFVADRAVERWTRDGGRWTLGPPAATATPSPVAASSSQTSAGEAPEAGGDRGTPAPPPAGALAALAAAAALASRRRFEP
jgi:hypothetical protein